MRIKYSTIIKFNIMLLLIMQLSYTKLLGNIIPIFSTSYISNPLVLFYLCICIFIIVVSIHYSSLKSNILFFEMTIMLILIIMALYNSSEKYGNVKFIYLIAYGLNYMYFFLAIPIYSLLRNNQSYFDTFLKVISVLCAGSYIIRAIISLTFMYTGKNILPAIALEGASVGWIRNGVLRINPPCIGIIYLPIVFYLYSESESKKHKLFYGAMIILGIWYMTFITQARSMMIYQLCVLILLLMLKNKTNSKKGIFVTIALICLSVILINSPVVGRLLESFSQKNVELGGSTTARLNAINYFGKQFMNNPFMGTGFQMGTDTRVPIGGDISDIGMLRSIYMLGFGMAVLYIFLFVRGFYVSYKIRKYNKNLSILVLGMTILIMLTDINIDCFWDIFAFAMPFYVAIVEYAMYRIKVNSMYEDK